MAQSIVERPFSRRPGQRAFRCNNGAAQVSLYSQGCEIGAGGSLDVFQTGVFSILECFGSAVARSDVRY